MINTRNRLLLFLFIILMSFSALAEIAGQSRPIPAATSMEIDLSTLDSAVLETDGQRVRPTIEEPLIFDIGDAEKELLEISRFLETQIPSEKWEELVTSANVTEYIVQEGDYLWSIARRFFGSGFYYSKIWSLNPKIKNPHEIEPGMVLLFDMGSADGMPTVSLGDFPRDSRQAEELTGQIAVDLSQFGDSVVPSWLIERERLKAEGVYFQYASAVTYEDLQYLSERVLDDEYERYEPPHTEIIIAEPGDQYDETGFDRSSVISFDFREGFHLTTFVTNNVVQDVGHIFAGRNERSFVQNFDTIYLKFNDSMSVRPGDRFSIYTPEGRVRHSISDREGHRYTIKGHVELIRPIDDVWEASVSGLSGVAQRGDRLTMYTPSLEQIVQVFSRRSIEAAIIGAYQQTVGGTGLGAVVYLDRGRLDGVEVGTIFETYDFIDRSTRKRITRTPTYRTGELVALHVTDNFSTALVLNASNEINLGALALSKSREDAMRDSRRFDQEQLHKQDRLRSDLENLDLEINLDGLARDLLEKADRLRMTDDEFDQLERQEREHSIIRDHQRDLQELERLEREISETESRFGEARLDEDRYLEDQDLDFLERQVLSPSEDAFESLDEIEREKGVLYMDEDLNARENPFGLTEFDLEEIDLLLNSGQE